MATKTQTLARRILPVALGLIAAVSAANVNAQVIDIDLNGSTTVYDAPAVYTSEGVHSILSTKPAMVAATPHDELTQAIRLTADRHALDPRLLEAVAWTESRFHQEAVSPKGAVGMMQLMGGTARDLGVDRFDWRQNIEGGASYLSQLLGRYRGDLPLALAAYNAGPGAVDRYGGAPPFVETQAYVRSVLTQLNARPALRVNQAEPPAVILIAP